MTETNNYEMHTFFSLLLNLFYANREMTCNHRIIRAFSEGNLLKLEVSHVTITFSQYDEKKAM